MKNSKSKREKGEVCSSTIHVGEHSRKKKIKEGGNKPHGCSSLRRPPGVLEAGHRLGVGRSSTLTGSRRRVVEGVQDLALGGLVETFGARQEIFQLFPIQFLPLFVGGCPLLKELCYFLMIMVISQHRGSQKFGYIFGSFLLRIGLGR